MFQVQNLKYDHHVAEGDWLLVSGSVLHLCSLSFPAHNVMYVVLLISVLMFHDCLRTSNRVDYDLERSKNARVRP